ncbi:hypothetical protein [Hoeflea prorocentri]|uniref:Uncharacterized protein n=1 Tax=Hoeflea prorocentri TaxID=1922333 RepID=A0A9X3ULR1_9HYPH|nr:hypothetical protein [Hoeflea prorocentri]MCY6382886.1 hypothetical protein [Hoeflea prorocentri]MDA5400686.1 hypothetical protein [Hoeflea prorocentri]
MGIYVDCDVYCLRPFPDDEYLFGWEGNESINNAVLKMPPDSELLRAIMQDAENPHFVPSWCSTRERRKLRIQQLLGHADTRPKLEWGSLGPRLLTHHIKRLGLEKLAKDIDYFYPSHYAHKRLLNCPDLTVKDHTTHRSLGLHVWSSGIPIKEIQPGSPLDEIVSGYRSQKQLSAETPFA